MAYDFTIKYAGPPINGEIQGWSPEDPITANKMNNIEAGIVEAWNKAEDSYTKQQVNDALSGLSANLSARIGEVDTKATQAKSIAEGAVTSTANGTEAMNQITAALDRNDGHNWPNLDQRLEDEHGELLTAVAALEEADARLNTAQIRFGEQINTMDGEVTEARGVKKYTTGGVEIVATKLVERLDDMDTQIGRNMTAASDVGTAKGKYGTLTARLNAIDGDVIHNTAMSTDITNIQNEILEAHGPIDSVTQLRPYLSLQSHFIANETAINDKISTSKIANDLVTTDTSKVLAAPQGKALDEKINTVNNKFGSSFNTANYTVDDALAQTEANANNYTDSLLGSGFDTTNTVAKAIEDLEDSYVSTNAELISDIETLQTEINGALISSVIKETVTEEDPETHEMVDHQVDKTYTHLDDRLEAIETHSAAIRTDINTIATELAMVDNVTHTIKDTNTKIDDLTADVAALASEIEMGQDEFGRLTGAETRIDDLENAINDETTGLAATKAIADAAKATADDAATASDLTTLAGRVTDTESDIETLDADLNTTTTGLKDRMTAAESALSNKASSTDLTNLAGRVSNLENEPKSATVDYSEAQITYDNVTGNPTIYTDNLKTTAITPSSDVDYLLQKGTKYYYWKYLNNKWELISGGGGSGSSNAEDFETFSTFELATKEVNKDYYVLQSDGIRHHYRYLKSTGENNEEIWTRIEIGIPISSLKSYQIARSQEVNEQTSEATEYLDLYGFDFGTEVSSDDVDTITNYQNYRLAHVELPKGGGGGSDNSSHKIYAKVRGDANMRVSLEAANRGITLNYGYTCYTYDQDSGYDYQSVGYTLTDSTGVTIASSDGVVNYLTKQEYDANAINISIPHIEQYCETNKTSTFILTLHSPINNSIRDKVLTVYVTVVEIALTSTFTDQQTYSVNNNLTIPYQFTGMSDITPTFEILLDNSSIAATITNTNIVIRREVLANKQGVHNLVIRAGQLISGSMLYSDPLTYQLGLIDGVTDNLMLFSGVSLKDNLTNEQYQVLKLPYYLYVPNGETIAVSYTAERITYNDSNVIINRENVSELNRPTENLSTGSYYYNFRIHDMIADTEYYAITVSAGAQSIIFNIKVNKAAEQINIKTDNLMFDFKPERYSNNVDDESLRLWSDTNNGVTYRMRIPDGAHFDWRTGGWVTVDDVPCFCVKAGSRVEFVQESGGTTSPLTLFWPDMEGLGGSNFKCTFKIDNVKTPNAPFLTSLDQETNTIINYGKTILASKQDLEDEDTLLHIYLNTKYIYTKTINNSNKTVKEAIGQTVLDNIPFSDVLTSTVRAAAEVDAKNSNKKKIKKYISNIYDIANQASTQTHREYLLQVLSGKQTTDAIDYSTIKSEITNYLFDETAYDAGTVTNTNATTVYNRLVNESADSSSVIYAYRQVEPVNFDALLNGFVVEGKAGKDGIIAMILFTFASTIETATTYIQTVSAQPISTNSFAKTGTFEVITTDAGNNVKTYEVEMLDEEGTGNYTEIVSIRDASNTETRAYGLELNALGSNIYLPSGVVSYAHSEGDIIEFEYNINPEITGRVNSSIIIYEDGVPSAAKLYTSRNDTFEQVNPGCLTIGSDDCDVYIYKMRLYSQALDNKDILANFYADGLTTDDMMNRYNRNKNLVNAAIITPQLVAEECPDLRVIMIEAPNLTGGKTSFIKNTKIRQIYKNGRPEDNWVALNAYHAGQGTSSDNYGVAGRNLDIMFGFDGIDTVIVPKPQKNNYTFDPTYKSILIKGLNEDSTNDILTAEEYEAAGYTVEYNGTGKVSFTETSVPNNWFNIKVNIASSENTNNAFLQKRFNRYLPYTTPAMTRDSKIKNDMEFFNCVIFIKETGTPSEFTEDKDLAVVDRPWHFYGIGNIGDSKKTDSTRVNVEGDPYEFCIEISDNGLKLSGFSSGVYYISEQSKTRSQTPRNQTNGNMDLDAVRTATSIHVCESNEYSVNGSNYNFSVVDPSDEVLYLVPTVTEAFTYYRRFMHIAAVWTEIGEPITFTRTSYGIKYPVSNAEWNCSLNDYHKTLYDTTSGKGWDKSYEFRYDITTKDGETVARNDLEAVMNELHQQVNKKAFADMYSWLVTSSNEEFKDEFNTRAVNGTSRWFIKESPLYWYLFTERYTMIDSRAKNTFYHYGKVFISQSEYNGDLVAELTTAASDPAAYAIAHNITAQGNVTAEAIAAAEIEFRLNAAQFVYDNRDTFTLDDTQASVNNGYRFELWDYDNDTALGINNNGQMVFSAGLEDIDKDVSGWIYNEAESVIWRRIRENTYDDLGALYVRLKGKGFNAENLIQEFDTLQAQFPEELWRMDFERKYYRPFISKGETTYLNDMANGRKRYQRRQFERNMAIYINSKYQRNGAYDENDIISFRPQFTWTAGRNTLITIKPYSTMYINFMLGNDDQTGQSISQRVQRGEAYTINASDYIHDFNNIQCILYNASRIMELDGLGNFECKQFILGAAKKLSVLKLGSVEYPNRSMADINNMGLSDGLPLLEELDLTNIQFGTAPDTFALDNFPLLKKLDATGCNIRSFTFKDGGMVENIIFPSVLTKIEFKNLYKLVDTYDDQNQLIPAVTLTGAANLINYYSVNSYSNSYQIVQNMLSNAGLNGITQLKLNDINWTITNLIELDSLAQLQEKLGNNMLLQGTITVTGKWSQVKLDDYKSIFGVSNITWITNPNQQVPEFKLTFYLNVDDVGNSDKIYYTKYVSPNEGESTIVLGDDPVYAGDCDVPTKDPSISKTYYFGTNKTNYYPWTGWRIYGTSEVPYNEKELLGNLDLIAIFSEEGRTYPLRWYLTNDINEEPVKQVLGIAYGSDYDGLAPTVLDLKKANKNTSTFSSSDGIHCSYSIFKGWEKTPVHLDETFLNNAQDAFCIYGIWETGNNLLINDIKSQETLDAKKLLTLSNINTTSASTILPINSTLELEMGYNNNTGTTIIGKDATVVFGSGARQKIYDETSILNFTYYYNNNNQLAMEPAILGATSIKPFEDMTNRGFTLAFDYRIDDNYISQVYSNGYVILCGCYSGLQSSTSQGFAIYYDVAGHIPKICFGDLSNQSTYTSSSIQNFEIANVSSTGCRNIVVIRHQPNSNKLQIYTGIHSQNGMLTTLNDNYFEREITWSNNSFDAPLCFGHFTTNTFSNVSTVRQGIGTSIYWAKYWDSDRGKDECTRLAAWPHEKLTFALEDYSNDNNQDIVTTTANNMIFSALQVSQYGGPMYQSYDTSVGTQAIWGYELNNSNNSLYKRIANERFFLGLPIEIQSIIEKTPSGALMGQIKHVASGNYYEILRTENTIDLAFLPTFVETGGNDFNGSYEGEAHLTFPWYKASNSVVYSYNNGFDFSTSEHQADYMNLRFFGIPINHQSNVVYTNYSESSPVYNRINSNGHTISRGDIFIYTVTLDNTTTTTAYIYANAADVEAGAPIVRVATGDILYCTTGGWVEAKSWWTRSVSAVPTDEYFVRATSQPFYYIEGQSGSLADRTIPTSNSGAYFVYSFGI